MNKEEIEYTIKTNRNTGEVVFSRGDYTFKQWGLMHEIIDLIEQLQQESKQLKEEINKIFKKEIKVRDMLYSIENGTLTRERLKQIDEVLFEIGDNNE